MSSPGMMECDKNGLQGHAVLVVGVCAGGSSISVHEGQHDGDEVLES